MLTQMSERMGAEHYGEERAETAEALAELIIAEEFEAEALAELIIAEEFEAGAVAGS